MQAAPRGRHGGAVRRASTRSLGSYNDARALEFYQGDDLEGFFKSLSKAVKKVASPIQKGLTAVGHAAGAAVTSKIGQGILGTALAVTGVGAAPAALIFGATKAGGNLIKKGGNLKHAATGFAQGAVEGVASNIAGKAVRGAKNAITSKLAKRGAASVVKHTAAGTAAVSDSPAIIDDILNKGVPAIADPIPQVAELPQVTAAPLPPDNSAEIAAANQAAAQQAADARAAAQASIDQANQAAAAAQAQGTAAAQQAAQQAADAAAQQQAAAQSAIAAAQAAAQQAADQASQQLQRRVSDSSSQQGGGSPFDDGSGDFSTVEQQQEAAAAAQAEAQAAADAQASARSSTTKKLVIAGGVLLGAAGVAVAMKKHKRKGAR